MEIGSEYAWPDKEYGSNDSVEALKEAFIYDDRKLVFSGRTAIEYVLKDIGKCERALLPSYCCQSMIDPFIDLGIEVSFYNVNFINGSLNIQIEIPNDIDVLLWCNYFGFFHDFPEKIVVEFQKRGGIVIEDITQSFLCQKPIHIISDYYVASLRKWGSMLCGGVAYKKVGKFQECHLEMPDEWFLKTKEDAMRLKKVYLSEIGDGIEKKMFLYKYGQTNEYFKCNYKGRGIDKKSCKMISTWYNDEIFERRRANARIIYKSLQGIRKLNFVFPEGVMDCPLFVPVVVEPEIRDRVKQKLVEKKIYCPQHWPMPTLCGAESNFYSMELSLICDQRYGKDEIQIMVEAIKNEVENIEL